MHKTLWNHLHLHTWYILSNTLQDMTSKNSTQTQPGHYQISWMCCVITISTKRTHLFKVHKPSANEHKKYISEFGRKSIYYLATKPFISLKHLAYSNFLNFNKIASTNVSFISSPSTSSQQHLDLILKQIDYSLHCKPDIKETFLNIATKFSNYTDFIFYTGGSVKQIGSSDCISGYGWIQCHSSSPKKEFKGSTLLHTAL